MEGNPPRGKDSGGRPGNHTRLGGFRVAEPETGRSRFPGLEFFAQTKVTKGILPFNHGKEERMSSPIPALLRNEILKAVRRKLPWFGLAMVVLLCVLIHGVAGQLSVTATSNGWGYLAFSMQLVFTDLGL